MVTLEYRYVENDSYPHHLISPIHIDHQRYYDLWDDVIDVLRATEGIRTGEVHRDLNSDNSFTIVFTEKSDAMLVKLYHQDHSSNG